MKLDYKKLLIALTDVEEERNIPQTVILDALKEAMAKAYKKNEELPDIDVVAEINEKKKSIDLFQNYVVVTDVEDDELEMSVEEARTLDKNAQIGDTVRRPVEIETMSRAAATLAKNVMRQKIREAEKEAVYNEYIGQLHEMVFGTIESIKDKFTLVNLGKTTALMLTGEQIPGERLKENQRIKVVITEVNKESKGAQVLVSRGDAMLVRRLFEAEVPEIFQGIVEIKAIAREAGERTKMAVLSHNPEVDPIGACIGPRGARVQEIIKELKGEKVDIFEWSEDITSLVQNVLSPAEIEAVIPNEDGSLIVIVAEDQLSLAIGKRGKNARLAVKLTNRKIDIKTRAELEANGVNYEALMEKAKERKEKIQLEALEKIRKAELEAAKLAESKRLETLEKLRAENSEELEQEFFPEEMQEVMDDGLVEEVDHVEETSPEVKEEEKIEEVVVEEKAIAEEKPVEVKKEEKKSAKHANLEELANKATYVSVFEKLVDNKAPRQEVKKKWKKKKNEEEEIKINNKELEEQIKKKLASQNNLPIYTEEELAEIEAQQRAEEEREYDFDYDEYEDYYDEEDDN
ncbi:MULTISPECIES: transcription termination factor NusA [Terrabacteria group]|uniref:transcription termination factor NusA n=1 Tax=Bacillati TaxID=1783272 RepID=UPI001C6E7D5B|nr:MULTISPECIES: transcription termination factor NusA [Terrabacteria group]MBW9211884.1 transcription termination factor NusA [Trueperella sp. zg.1013]